MSIRPSFFIETPIVNNKMIEIFCITAVPQTKLCIAADITCEGEYIKNENGERNGKGRFPICLKFLVFFSCINNFFCVFVFTFETTAEKFR